ncbi:alpha-tocopherol transfer protein-like [Tenebrio molitor]|uniref:alpha-tocopherol transfer protein-like n=1 Tax=Tenebrio molitor TaxID=7067 RepID=UPI00362475A6
MNEKAFLPVPENIFVNVLKRLEKNEKSFNDDVVSVRKWMETQLHLPEILDSRCISNFLISNKFCVENAKEKIDMYYTIRSKLHDVYGQINPKLAHMKELMDLVYLVPYPKKLDNIYEIAFFKVRSTTFLDKLEPYNILRHVINIQEVRLRENVLSGDVFVIDCEGLPLSFAVKITPTLVFKSLIMIYEKVFSCCLKDVYIVNLPSFGKAVLAMVKKIIKPKLFERIHICSDINEVKTKIPANMLPKDFGGEGPSCEDLQEMVKLKFMEKQELFDRLDKIRVDERIRPEKLRDDEILGFHGNFKKLDID